MNCLQESRGKKECDYIHIASIVIILEKNKTYLNILESEGSI